MEAEGDTEADGDCEALADELGLTEGEETARGYAKPLPPL